MAFITRGKFSKIHRSHGQWSGTRKPYFCFTLLGYDHHIPKFQFYVFTNLFISKY